ncbi:hypothetical protein Aau02nite_70890 [Amorphoplanes auranticolor]|uniref:Uncharacterized protein n=1 Tax=Actinoplanes auranticolor TaxID=47988 RepID=A0A919SRX6_9ACTN|nr:hypothetical protein Aau02nite_70890 [Actinoplanes auranticolor]
MRRQRGKSGVRCTSRSLSCRRIVTKRHVRSRPSACFPRVALPARAGLAFTDAPIRSSDTKAHGMVIRRRHSSGWDRAVRALGAVDQAGQPGTVSGGRRPRRRHVDAGAGAEDGASAGAADLGMVDDIW